MKPIHKTLLTIPAMFGITFTFLSIALSLEGYNIFPFYYPLVATCGFYVVLGIAICGSRR